MKKLLSLSPFKILAICAIGLLTTLGSFWHHQMNQTQMDRMNVLSQGVGTCFDRVSQTFTAMMIKDVKSAYLARGFLGLSDECLSETIKGINPFKREVSRGHEILNKLISEVHWFHEKVTKIHAPTLAGGPLTASLVPLTDLYTKIEALKTSLVDQIDAINALLRQVQANDEILMGLGLLLFVIGLSVLSLQEFNRIQFRRELEKEALNLLKAGQSNVGAYVDALIDRALTSQSMPVTAQIFKDYHGDLLERLSGHMASRQEVRADVTKANKKVANVDTIAAPGKKEADQVTLEEEEASLNIPRTSLKEVLVSIQNVHGNDQIQTSDVRDVILATPFEVLEQIMNAAINKLNERRFGNKKIMISNQIHSDRSIIALYLAGNTFSASELEYADAKSGAGANSSDMNLMILKEMVAESKAGLHIENKADRSGNITGMSVRLTLKRAPKEKSKLVSVIRGKKKDLSREMMN
jgi:hypothetical protein